MSDSQHLIHHCNKEDDIQEIKEELREQRGHIAAIREKLYNGMSDSLTEIKDSVVAMQHKSGASSSWKGAIWRIGGSFVIALGVGFVLALALYLMARSANAEQLAEFVGAILHKAVE